MSRIGIGVSLCALAGIYPFAAAISQTSAGKTRTYYIAADEVVWNYAPSGRDLITGKPFEGMANIWTKRGPDRIGLQYKKAIYREYTDGSFSTLKPRPTQWEHLGYLGPVIRAEVGDTIRVVFKNNGTYSYTMHPHGVIYDKNSEGAGYSDNTSGADKRDDAVPPGGTHVYVWPVPERAGPSHGETSSILWMYHSHAHEAADVNAGLMGPLIVTARGRARADGTPTDVDRELVVTFAEIDENLSWYIDENIQTYAERPATVRKVQGPSFIEPFGLSNLKESINGFLYGNAPMVTMQTGERVRWYIMSTTNFELHAPHWHGNVVVAQHMRTDVLTLGTMGMIVADMVPDNPGVWLFHCHIEPHNTGGMQMLFSVLPRPASSQ